MADGPPTRTDRHGLALTTGSDAAARHFDEAINQYLGYKHDPETRYPAIAHHRATAAHALTLRNVPGPFNLPTHE